MNAQDMNAQANEAPQAFASRVRRLQLSDFRSYAALDLPISAQVVALTTGDIAALNTADAAALGMRDQRA